MKVVLLLDPKMCIQCRFAGLAEVTLRNGEVDTVRHCRRLDCDNWSTVVDEVTEINLK